MSESETEVCMYEEWEHCNSIGSRLPGDSTDGRMMLRAALQECLAHHLLYFQDSRAISFSSVKSALVTVKQWKNELAFELAGT